MSKKQILGGGWGRNSNLGSLLVWGEIECFKHVILNSLFNPFPFISSVIMFREVSISVNTSISEVHTYLL